MTNTITTRATRLSPVAVVPAIRLYSETLEAIQQALDGASSVLREHSAAYVQTEINDAYSILVIDILPAR